MPELRVTHHSVDRRCRMSRAPATAPTITASVPTSARLGAVPTVSETAVDSEGLPSDAAPPAPSVTAGAPSPGAVAIRVKSWPSGPVSARSNRARELPRLGHRSARAGEAGIAPGAWKVSCILIHRRRTCHRGRRWRREHSDNDRHKRQATTAKTHIEPCFVPRCAENSNPPPGDADPRVGRRRQAGKASPGHRGGGRGPLRRARGGQRRLLQRAHGRRHGGDLVGRSDRAGDGRMASLAGSGFCRGRRRVPRRIGGLDGDLHRLGKRCRRRLRRGRRGHSAISGCSSWWSSRPPGERPHVVERPRAGPRGRRRPGPREPLRAVVRRQPEPRDLPPVRRRTVRATRSGTGMASPRRWPRASSCWSGSAATPGPRGSGPSRVGAIRCRSWSSTSPPRAAASWPVWPGWRSSWRSARAALECSRAP